MKPLFKIFFLILLVNYNPLGSACYGSEINKSKKSWTIVSIPDFLNVDCDYPQMGWEDALNYILNSIKKENPEFVMVAGDLVMGHWDNKLGNDADTVKKYSQRYYSNWIQRMNDHNLKFYTSVGDHDIGDDAWRDAKKFKSVELYRKAFSDNLKMPQNGPDNRKGTAFWWRYNNVLFISVDVFEDGQSELGFIKIGVTGDQLKWVETVLNSNPDVDHRILAGHVPVLGPVRQWSSSGLNISEGRESDFWQLMKKYRVDAYLCGEVHAITCKERDGIMQVAHGGLIGYNTRINYMVMKFTDDKIEMELKEIDMMPHGDFLWQTKNNRPLEYVTISDSSKTRGFYPVGSLTIDKSGKKEFKNRSGYFLQEYESSQDTAFPIFRKNEIKKVRTELPRMILK
jgi:hypothetical protein